MESTSKQNQNEIEDFSSYSPVKPPIDVIRDKNKETSYSCVSCTKLNTIFGT